MPRIVGPILGFRGRDDTWRLAIVGAHEGGTSEGALTVIEAGQCAGIIVSAAPLGDVGGASFFGYEFAVRMQADERVFEYGFAGEERRWRFVVPGRYQPLRIGYASCNGFSVPSFSRHRDVGTISDGERRQVRIFVSYAHQDRPWCDALLEQLGWLRHSEALKVFDDKQLKPGDNWDESIKAELDAADVVVALITSKFVGSRYCTINEMLQALEGRSRIIPVLVEHVDFEALPLQKLQALPVDDKQSLKPVAAWRTKAEKSRAWAQVARAIRVAAEELSAGSPGHSGGRVRATRRERAQPPEERVARLVAAVNAYRRSGDQRGEVSALDDLGNTHLLSGDMKPIADKNAVWRDLAATHVRQPLHMLLLGGNQVYADQLWDTLPALRGFNELPRERRLAIDVGQGLLGEIERFYVDTYRGQFSQEPVAEALASIPSLMMWDDHDIFDGWGSYSPEEQASPVFQTIFAAARTCFSLFQLQSNPRAPSWPALPGQPAFNALLRVGDVGLLVLDLRSERSQTQILAADTWNVVLDALDRTQGLQHLLVMSSIPVIHPDMSFLERGLGFVPGMQGIEDGLHDHWVSYNHRIERLQLVHRLLDFAEAKGTRVSIVSGDVHVAAIGVIESTRRPSRYLYANVINQLTSSPIVHPPPQQIVRYLLEELGREVNELDRDIRARMLQFPGTNYRIIDARNWLSLEFDDRGCIRANWHLENAPHVITKVVHPCERADL